MVLSMVMAASGGAYLLTARAGSSSCANLYGETGDERFRGASAWTCFWAEDCARLFLETGDARFRDASAWTCLRARQRRASEHAEIAKRDQEVAAERTKEKEIARVKAQQDEAALMEELRAPVCASLLKLRLPASTRPTDTFDVDLMGLSGHASVYSLQAVCRDCPDQMWSYWDANGARFCTVGGIGGKPCSELKQFPTRAEAHREGTVDALWSELGCR
jgi:hypothetical protein